MKIVVSPRAEKELKRVSKIDQIALVRKIKSIPKSSFSSRIEKLKGYENIFRLRIGNYRIVYRKKAKEIYIILIGHRKDVYHILKHLLK